MKLPHACLALSALLVFQCSAPAAEKRGITAEDYLAFHFVSDPQLSPDAKQVAYVITVADAKKNRRESSIWLLSVDNPESTRRISAEGFTSNSPRWSPDGSTLAFLSTRNAEGAAEPSHPQIYLLPMNGGEALPLTKLKNGASAIEWSPDGARLVCLSRSGPSDSTPVADRKSDVRHYTHILYNFNDTGWFDDKRSHLWVVDAKSGSAKQITTGDDWDDTDPQWSPDSKRIAFVSNRTGKQYEDDLNSDVWVIPAEGGELVKISDHPFEDASPRWSPDGTEILFTGQTKRREFARLYIAPSTGGVASKLAVDHLDTIPGELHWASGREVLFATGTKGTTHIFRADLGARTVSPVTSGERAVHNFEVNEKTGRMVYLSNDFEHLDEVFISDVNGGNERQLTHANQQLWDTLDLQKVERLPYKSTDGWAVDGFLVKPRGWQPGKKYPLILSVHGGPAGQYGVDWYQEFQVYAAKGWGVFFCNPRGSTGYGEKFERGIVNNWGGMDYADIMAGLDAAISKNDWIDTSRLGVTGGSYGGFMTNWVVGHTNRFKAAVTLRSLSNFISDDGTRDGPYGHQDDFKGVLFDDFDQYWNASPLKYAANVRTPTLILHSDNDFRVPLEQGEQWFRALKHYGVTTELVIFPRENHNLTRTGEPKHLVESMNWQIWWFERYLNGDGKAKAPDAQ